MPMSWRRIAAALALALASLSFASSERSARQGAVSMEYDIDRPGSDIASFDVADANPQVCRARCANDARCRAFTFVRPGIQGRYARCYLKNTVPQRRADRCCVSGVKQ